jgi:murein DD-endopeptidase MepM/ murein hydrolase activator NlpD
MIKTHLSPRVARHTDDAQPVSESAPAAESGAPDISRREPFSRRLSHTPSHSISAKKPDLSKQSAKSGPFGQHIPIERWFARFAVLVGGKLAWLTTCDQGRSLLFRYTAHFVILAVLVGAIGLVSTAKTTAAASNGSAKRLVNSVAQTTSNPSGDSSEVYGSFGQGGPIVVDQIVVAPQANPYTAIPSRERRGVITYTVQAGDTLFGIAAQFGLRPESVLWANYDSLEDNPHLLRTGMDLAIPPVNGIVYTVADGDTVESIAEKYKVTPDAIYVDGYEWNLLKPGEQPFAGASLIIPGGSREFKAWTISAAENAPKTSYDSSGAPVVRGNIGTCGNVAPGLVGTGSFIWPAAKHWVSGNNYAGWHPGIDLAARLGDPIYAADNGVVIYAGWNNWGYGNLVVIDHGNGWQTWYAHNSEIYVGCGQNIYQGSVIAAAGSTGRSTGPHLHFETRFQGTLPNPFNVLPPP